MTERIAGRYQFESGFAASESPPRLRVSARTKKAEFRLGGQGEISKTAYPELVALRAVFDSEGLLFLLASREN